MLVVGEVPTVDGGGAVGPLCLAMTRSQTTNTATARDRGDGITIVWAHVSGSHGFLPRGHEVPVGSSFRPGMFGRLFPDLPRFEPDEAALTELGLAMLDPAPPPPATEPQDPAGDNRAIPAGYTYLGQFVDHDISLDLTSLGEQNTDPQATANFRTPKMDLDSLYLLGPAGSPHLFQRADRDLFEIGVTGPSTGGSNIPGSLPNDLPRGPNGFALAGDHRNDENLIVAQLHLAMLKFHNEVVAELRRSGPPSGLDVFAEARRIVTWHYQWVVLHDFLERVADPAVVHDVLANGRRFYHFGDWGAFLPVEFSVAAYRLGHSMVREDYSFNRVFAPKGPNIPPEQGGELVTATLALLFKFTGLSGDTQPVPTNWVIDWRRFFRLAGSDDVLFSLSRKINPLITQQLHELPGPPDMSTSLAVRNLLRGRKMGLPTGQAVAHKMCLPPLSRDQLAAGPDGAVAARHGFDSHSPLWWYILKEAEAATDGERLGPVGSRILAEVFVGLLESDPKSFLSQQRDWAPELPSTEAGRFEMADILAFVDDANPLG